MAIPLTQPGNQEKVDANTASVQECKVGYADFPEAIHDALNGSKGREVTLEDGRHSIEFVSAIYQPARTQTPVHMPLDEGAELYESWLPKFAFKNETKEGFLIE